MAWVRDAVVITKLPLANPGDSRGPIREIKESLGYMQVTDCQRKMKFLPYYLERLGISFIFHFIFGPLANRFKKQSFGHVHHEDTSKSPEQLYLLRGKVEIVWWEEGSTEKFSQIVSAGSKIVIPLGIAHVLKHRSREFIILELRATWFRKDHSDTIKVQEP